MLHTQVMLVLTLGIATTAATQEEADAPKGPPPEFVTVVAIDKEQAVLELEYTYEAGLQYVTLESKYKGADGSDRTLKVMTPKPVLKQRVLKLKLEYADAFDPSGRKLNIEDVWNRLTVGATVLIPVDGQMVDSAYLRTLAKETLVFVSPQCAKWRRNIPFEGAISESPVDAAPRRKN